jgi:vacuolar-type H+-ATPase subunit E/Vma4
MTPAQTFDPAVSDTDRLVQSIREQCAAEVAAVTAQSRERAQRIADAADAEVDRIQQAARRDGEDSGRRQAAKLLAAAEAESRLRWLGDREALVEEAIGCARQRLDDLPNLPGAVQLLAELIRESLQPLPPGAVRIRLPDTSLQLLSAALRAELAAQRWTLRFETDHIPGGGVIAETENGRLRFDNSFAARTRRGIDRLRRAVADELLAQHHTDARGATPEARTADGTGT